ncbi:hypothetical protein QR680_011917 [Steinernema hermaphroditum]|uniref:Uncharacterized protein n=1 Tax=Steinernema hermaphroditum TaxID=289476 RepID=A0AA39LZK9_9BILA|nr:hypothetical protein QR680_011917 [Steinernema hermaphroditum]
MDAELDILFSHSDPRGKSQKSRRIPTVDVLLALVEKALEINGTSAKIQHQKAQILTVNALTTVPPTSVPQPRTTPTLATTTPPTDAIYVHPVVQKVVQLYEQAVAESYGVRFNNHTIIKLFLQLTSITFDELYLQHQLMEAFEEGISNKSEKLKCGDLARVVVIPVPLKKVPYSKEWSDV